MSEIPGDNGDWQNRWKKVRRKAIPYAAIGFTLEIAAILFFSFTSFWYQPILTAFPWWLWILLILAGVPFLIYFAILARRSWKLIPDYDFEEKTEN